MNQIGGEGREDTGSPGAAKPISREAQGLGALIANRLARHFSLGTLTIRWPNGASSCVEGALPGPTATLVLNRWRAVRRLLVGGAVGFTDAYINGDWDSPDLAGLIELGAVNRAAADHRVRSAAPVKAVSRLRHLLSANTRRGSRRNISHHYDLGNAFYSQWLDPTLSYSAAVFERGDEPLDQAQSNKCRRLLEALDARPGQTLLEVGCGWGHLASLAARERDLSVTAITVSKEQYEFTRRRVYEDGLGEKVSVQFTDYRDIDGEYDHMVSVEMFEAVGEKYWPVFFDNLRERLKPGGRAALQIITIDDAIFGAYRKSVDFIQKYVFPGGMLPSPGVLRREVERAGLDWRQDWSYGAHYAKTLMIWRDRFLAAWPSIHELGFDERFKRLWEFYLAYCEGGFRAGNIDLRQIALTKS